MHEGWPLVQVVSVLKHRDRPKAQQDVYSQAMLNACGAFMVFSTLSTPPTPGTLMLVGGGETTPAMVSRFFELIGGKDAPIVVFPLTRESPAESGPASLEMLQEAGATQAELIVATTWTPSERRTLAARLLRARGIWIPGGDQNLLVERLGQQWAADVLGRAYRGGTSIFGTSAGAMIMSDPMIGGNGDDGNPLQRRGLGLVPFVVDTHFLTRRREPRLLHAIQNWSGVSRGVGLDEGGWILWQDRVVETRGNVRWYPSAP